MPAVNNFYKRRRTKARETNRWNHINIMEFLFFCCDWCFQFGAGLGCWARKRWTLGKSGSDRGTHTKSTGSFQWKLCLVVHNSSGGRNKQYFSVFSSMSPYLRHCNLPSLLWMAQNIIYLDFHTGAYWIIHTQQQQRQNYRGPEGILYKVGFVVDYVPETSCT